MKTARRTRALVARLLKKRIRERKDAAKVILTRLIDAGMTQKEIGEYLGVTQAAISKQLNGKVIANTATLVCLTMLAEERHVRLPRDVQWRPNGTLKGTSNGRQHSNP